MPRRRQRPSLRLAISHNTRRNQIGIIQHRAERVTQRIAQLSSLMNRARRLGRNMRWNSSRKRKLFEQFSFPRGIPSHVAPETPGSIHEGGELGYSLSHAFGAVLDNPDLIA